MLKSILVPLADSPLMESIIQMAGGLAGSSAVLTGAIVLDEPAIFKHESAPLGASDFLEHKHKALLETAQKLSSEYKEQFAKICQSGQIKYRVWEESGDPLELIAAESHRHDLIILSAKSNLKYATQREFCDTAQQLLRNNPRPVIYATAPYKGIKKILILDDGSTQAAKAVHLATFMGLFEKRQVHIMSINSDELRARAICGQTSSFLNVHDIKAETHAIHTVESPAGIILDEIKKIEPDLVIMGAFGMGGLKEFFFGSVTRILLNQTVFSLFIYH